MVRHRFQQSLVCVVLVSTLVPSVAEQQPQTPTRNTNMLKLGFDPSKIPDPNPRKGKPVARAFDKYLYGKPAEASPARGAPDRVIEFIWTSLSKRYMGQHKITATTKEIEQYIEALGLRRPLEAATLSKEGKAALEAASKDERAALEAELEATWREAAMNAVKRWKMDKMLYSQYGDPVIFQQLNPGGEPVGAYRKFLQDMEKAKVFEIFDDEAHKRFWKHFEVKKSSSVIPAEEVDFSKPWWLQLERQGGAKGRN